MRMDRQAASKVVQEVLVDQKGFWRNADEYYLGNAFWLPVLQGRPSYDSLYPLYSEALKCKDFFLHVIGFRIYFILVHNKNWSTTSIYRIADFSLLV